MFFYVPSFICGTLIGGSIAFAFLKKLSSAGALTRFQNALGSPVYEYKGSVIGNAVSIAAIGVILFVVINLAKDLFKINSAAMPYITYGILGAFVLAALVYTAVKLLGRKTNEG